MDNPFFTEECRIIDEFEICSSYFYLVLDFTLSFKKEKFLGFQLDLVDTDFFHILIPKNTRFNETFLSTVYVK